MGSVNLFCFIFASFELFRRPWLVNFYFVNYENGFDPKLYNFSLKALSFWVLHKLWFDIYSIYSYRIQSLYHPKFSNDVKAWSINDREHPKIRTVRTMRRRGVRKSVPRFFIRSWFLSWFFCLDFIWLGWSFGPRIRIWFEIIRTLSKAIINLETRWPTWKHHFELGNTFYSDREGIGVKGEGEFSFTGLGQSERSFSLLCFQVKLVTSKYLPYFQAHFSNWIFFIST